jgi:Fe-S-cluster containining protein
MPDIPISSCRRCGTCCKKGGPAFHHQDRNLIETGIILLKDLYTIRKGERARDNVKGGLFSVPSDIIKIKSNGQGACVFFDGNGTCTIYENRPSECRALKCWDTREIEAMYSENRLTREDLLSGIDGLWDLIEEHQSRCEKIEGWLNELNRGQDNEASEKISQVLQYDAHIRSLSVEKSGIDPEMTDFLFGRPLSESIPGLKARNQIRG